MSFNEYFPTIHIYLVQQFLFCMKSSLNMNMLLN